MVKIRAAQVTLRAPWLFDRQLTDQILNVVLVEELNPPEGEVPVSTFCKHDWDSEESQKGNDHGLDRPCFVRNGCCARYPSNR